MDLLFIMEGDDIKDIFDCRHFKAVVDILILAMKADFDVNLDDQIAGNFPI